MYETTISLSSSFQGSFTLVILACATSKGNNSDISSSDAPGGRAFFPDLLPFHFPFPKILTPFSSFLLRRGWVSLPSPLLRRPFFTPPLLFLFLDINSLPLFGLLV